MTLATSPTRTGAPSRTASMVWRMSSIERIWPTPRTTADCGPILTVLAPTLMLPLFSAVEHLLQRQAVGQQPVEIDGDVVGLGLAAPAVTSMTPGTALKRRWRIQSWMVLRSVTL